MRAQSGQLVQPIFHADQQYGEQCQGPDDRPQHHAGEGGIEDQAKGLACACEHRGRPLTEAYTKNWGWRGEQHVTLL